MPDYTPRNVGLQEAVTWIHEGRLRLPEFQRDFKWPFANQRALLDSIQRRYPVGTLLFLEVKSGETGSLFGNRAFQGAPDVPKAALDYLVLDGQQRLSTCYRAFSPDAPKAVCIDLRSLYASTKGLPKQQVTFADHLHLKSKPLHPKTLLPNHDLLALSSVTNRDELRDNIADYVDNLAARPDQADFRRFVDRVLEGYLDPFFDYGFPTVVLPHDLDVEAVAMVFTVINTTGLKLSAFDLCVATLFPHNVNLRELWKTAANDDDVKEVDDDGTNALQTVALLARKSPKKAGLPKVIKPHHIGSHWVSAIEGLRAASKMFSSLGAPYATSIPYDAMVPALAAALSEVPAVNGPAAEEDRRKQIARWMYQTAIEQRYNEGTDVKQEKDTPEATAWLKGGPMPSFLDSPVVWTDNLRNTGSSGARSRAFMALLNDASPIDFVKPTAHTGRGVGRVDSQLHHVFPRAYLKTLGLPDSKINLALNFSFLTPESNRFISDKKPSEYIGKLVSDRVGKGTPELLATKDVKAIMASHLVNDEAWDALLRDDYEGFLDARGAAIRERLIGRYGLAIVIAPSEQVGEDEDELEGAIDEP